MLTQMTDADWEIVVEAFRAARSRRGGRRLLCTECGEQDADFVVGGTGG